MRVTLLLAFGVPVLWMALPVTLGGATGWTVVVGRSMEPTLDSGDLVVTRSSAEYGIGDVVVYRIPDGEPGAGVMVIHRISGGSAADGFVTTGDNRDFHDPWRPRNADIIGRHWRTIPVGGHVIATVRSPLVVGLTMSMMVYMFTLEFIAAAEAYRPRHTRRRSRGFAFGPGSATMWGQPVLGCDDRVLCNGSL